jgi:uncharacterized membrane protein YhaH (DUF805 family)
MAETMSKARRGATGGFALLRALALVVTAAGAAGSLGLMFRFGNRQPSWILIAMFTIWVSSPFAGLVLADVVAKRWRAVPRAALHCLMLLLPVGSVAMYGGLVAMPPGASPAAVFLVVPFVSWALLAIVFAVASAASRRQPPARPDATTAGR